MQWAGLKILFSGRNYLTVIIGAQVETAVKSQMMKNRFTYGILLFIRHVILYFIPINNFQTQI